MKNTFAALKPVIVITVLLLITADHVFAQTETQNPSFPFWKTQGNSNTNGIHYLGTSDNRSLRFRTNNTQRMMIDSVGYVGIGTVPNNLLDVFYFGADATAAEINYSSTTSVATRAALGISASALSSLSGDLKGINLTSSAGSSISNNYGMYMQSFTSGSKGYGLYSFTIGGIGTDTAFGIYTIASSAFKNFGIKAGAVGTSGTVGSGNYGIQAYASGNPSNNNWAGFFGDGITGDGKVYVKDTLAIGTTSPQRRFHLSGLTSGMRYAGVGTGGTFVTAPASTDQSDRLLYADVNGDIKAIPTGTDGNILGLSGGVPTWVSSSANSWGLTGNSGTTVGTNFLGTTDTEPLELKVAGSKSGYIDYTSPANTSLGYQALLSISTGTSNSAFGFQALTDNTTGTNNSATGYLALNNNTIGLNNVAMGSQALYSNTAGGQTTAIGSQALFTQSYNGGGTAYASDNTAVGYQSLFTTQPTAISTGIQNTAIGSLSLRANTNGYENTASGYKALFANTTGNYNTAHGWQALVSSTTGNFNSAFGLTALSANTTGNNNTAIGANTLFSNKAGGNGVAVGYLSQQYVNDQAGLWDNANTSIGHMALRG